jgi:hypothetical protein
MTNVVEIEPRWLRRWSVLYILGNGVGRRVRAKVSLWV